MVQLARIVECQPNISDRFLMLMDEIHGQPGGVLNRQARPDLAFVQCVDLQAPGYRVEAVGILPPEVSRRSLATPTNWKTILFNSVA